VEVDAALTQLRAILESEPQPANGNSGAGQAIVATGQLSGEQIEQARQFLAQGFSLFNVVVHTDPTSFAPSARLSQAAIALMDVGELLLQNPTMDALARTEHDNKLEAIVATKSTADAVEAMVKDVAELVSWQVSPYKPPEDTAPSKKEKPKGASTASRGTPTIDVGVEKTVRINVERLDMLMNLVGELVTDRNRLLQIESSLLARYGKEDIVTDMGEMTSHVGRVVDQLQEEVMHARMLPIGNTFHKMPRLVRDVARVAGKQVNLVIEGEDTELDRTLIEYIGDPLIHLLRNAVDHGLEAPQERLAAGKQPTGTVKLIAAHQEGHIVITVEDDGNGIDPEKVRNAAVKRGIITAEEAAQLDEEESVDLIFRPNLSTAAEVTEVSGRGVGMDVVRSNIERLSGSVIVTSKMGQGTTFKITLPLTLAIVQTMLVSLRGISYAIPLSNIIESLYFSDVTISTVKGRKVIYWRDSVLPLFDLREYFTHPRMQGDIIHDARNAIITVSWGKQRVGLVVDRIIGKQDIVVKSLSAIIGELPGISGGTILGDGSIALIIDIPGLIAAVMQARKQGVAA